MRAQGPVCTWPWPWPCEPPGLGWPSAGLRAAAPCWRDDRASLAPDWACSAEAENTSSVGRWELSAASRPVSPSGRQSASQGFRASRIPGPPLPPAHSLPLSPPPPGPVAPRGGGPRVEEGEHVEPGAFGPIAGTQRSPVPRALTTRGAPGRCLPALPLPSPAERPTLCPPRPPAPRLPSPGCPCPGTERPDLPQTVQAAVPRMRCRGLLGPCAQVAPRPSGLASCILGTGSVPPPPRVFRGC